MAPSHGHALVPVVSDNLSASVVPSGHPAPTTTPVLLANSVKFLQPRQSLNHLDLQFIASATSSWFHLTSPLSQIDHPLSSLLASSTLSFPSHCHSRLTKLQFQENASLCTYSAPAPVQPDVPGHNCTTIFIASLSAVITDALDVT